MLNISKTILDIEKLLIGLWLISDVIYKIWFYINIELTNQIALSTIVIR